MDADKRAERYERMDHHCRRCSVPLQAGNARTSRGRFVGICRPCESEEKREREARRTGRTPSRTTDSRRKYPIPAAPPGPTEGEQT